MATPTLAVILPLVTAFATGALGLLGLVITKETKVSEFRQAWIDALRLETSVLLAALHEVLGLLQVSADDDKVHQRAVNSSLRDANAALFSIRLRLNKNELNAAALLEVLNSIEVYSSSEEFDPAIIDKMEKQVVELTGPVLKEAWLTVREGEDTYRKIRKVAGIVVLCLGAVAAILLLWALIAGGAGDTISDKPISGPITIYKSQSFLPGVAPSATQSPDDANNATSEPTAGTSTLGSAQPAPSTQPTPPSVQIPAR